MTQPILIGYSYVVILDVAVNVTETEKQHIVKFEKLELGNACKFCLINDLNN